MNTDFIKLKIDSNNFIALYKNNPQNNVNGKHILLTHGTFSNRKVLKGITEYLTKKGFTCWVFEWRNHGNSSSLKGNFNFETIGKHDFKIVFDYLFLKEKIKSLDCITHSGGGISLTISLIVNPKNKSKINSITFFGCQAFGASNSYKNYIRILIGKYFSKIIGYIPAKITGSEENEPYFFMKQWFNWNLKKNFLGSNSFNYLKQMKEIQIPILSIVGKGDTLIAPPKACNDFLSAFNNSSNKFCLCSKENNFLEDYNHSRVLHSKNASKEIYPIVLDWIKR